MQFEIVNLGQGKTGAFYNGLTLDTLVDPLRGDVLVYEFFVNDSWKCQVRDLWKLHFWLARAKSLYNHHAGGRPPPPIVLLFFWQTNIGSTQPRFKKGILEHGIDQPLRQAWDAITYYKSQGWNIQVVSVGSAYNNITAIANDPTLIVDDIHHPNCYSVHMITNMMKHAIYDNIATCTHMPLGSREFDTQPSMDVPPAWLDPNTPTDWTDPIVTNVDDTRTQKLFEFLQRDDVRVASLSPWTPRAGHSQLQLVANVTNVEAFSLERTELEMDFRADRKRGYLLPQCNSGEENMTVSLAEPLLEWIGFGLSPLSRRAGSFMEVNCTINGIPVDVPNHPYLQEQYVFHWIRIRESVPRAPMVYEVSLCKSVKNTRKHLRQLVGVMLPDMSQRELGLLKSLS